MKKNLFTFTLFMIGSINLFSQSSSYDISILIKKDFNVIEVANDSMLCQEFILKERINYVKKEISFNRKGFLQTKLEVPAKSGDSRLILIYKNVKNKNPPLVFKKEKIKNLLTYPKDFENIKIEKIRELLNKSKNIYVIESSSISNYYLLKKVTLDNNCN